MDCSSPGSSVHEISQAGILEWVAISFSRGSSRPRDRTQVSCIAGGLYRLSHQGSPRTIFITIIFSIIITIIIISASLHVGKGSLTSWGSLLSLSAVELALHVNCPLTFRDSPHPVAGILAAGTRSAEGQARWSHRHPRPHGQGALRCQVLPPRPGWPGWAGPGLAGQGWAARLEVRAGSKGWCPRPQPEGPRHHDGGSQAPKQGGEQPPALWAPDPGARADGGGRGGSRYPGASGERGGGGGERGERPAPGVPGRTEGAPRRPPRALRAAGGAGAKREAQEEVPEEAEEVWQGRHSTAPSALGWASRRLPESWSPIPASLTLSASLPCPAPLLLPRPPPPSRPPLFFPGAPKRLRELGSGAKVTAERDRTKREVSLRTGPRIPPCWRVNNIPKGQLPGGSCPRGVFPLPCVVGRTGISVPILQMGTLRN